ncbi:MAG: hypothetical protein V3V40_06320 [Nitrosomonadaceae bacterium]
MPIKSTESNKTLDVGVFFDITSGTGEKTITVTNPVTGVKTTFPDSRITAPGVASADGFEAGTYMQLKTIVTDFPDPGQWPICTRFQDPSTTPVTDYYGDDNTITIGKACEE